MKKKIISLLFTGVICFGLAVSANAETVEAERGYETVVQSESDVTRATVIVYKIRYYRGRHQIRRWNETFGYWVDPYWIDV